MSRFAVWLLLPCLLQSAAWAAPSAQFAQAEIQALIAALGASNCEFERNGRWHGAARAKAHLERKYEWLRKRDLAPTAELFIARAATASSASGRPYRVRCAGGASVASARWFGEQLAAIRHESSSPAR